MTNVSYKNISKKKRRYFSNLHTTLLDWLVDWLILIERLIAVSTFRYFSDLYTTLLDSSWSYCVVMFTTSFYGSWIIFGWFNQIVKSETDVFIASTSFLWDKSKMTNQNLDFWDVWLLDVKLPTVQLHIASNSTLTIWIAGAIYYMILHLHGDINVEPPKNETKIPCIDHVTGLENV